MTLPTEGPISLKDIQAEFGGPTPIKLENYYRGGAYVLNTDYAPNVPASGPISLSNFYGAKRTTLTTVSFNNTGSNFIMLPSTFAVGTLTVVSMTGGGGGGGGPDSYPGRVGYPGLTITGGTIPANPGDVVNAYVGAGGGAGGSGGGGGGGGGKIICTKLFELGLMSKEIYLADQAFGQELLQRSPDIYNGYRAWAEIVVDWMDGRGPKMMPWMSDEQFSQAARSWSTRWAKDIATPWAEEMAYQMKQSLLPNNTGKAIMAIGTPICKIVGVWQRIFGPSKQPAGFGKGLMLIPVFVLLKLVAELGRLLEGK